MRYRGWDRDFILTKDGLFFCVIGYTHPKNRLISYLRYSPNTEGSWGAGGRRYQRAMTSYTIPVLMRNVERLAKRYPKYIFNSKVFHVRMSGVPIKAVSHYYKTEGKLRELSNRKNLDPLQRNVLNLTKYLSSQSRLNEDKFGVTGSILIDIHNPSFSDIDLTVTGKRESLGLSKTLHELLDSKSDVTRISGESLRRWCHERQEDHGVTVAQAEAIYKKKWNYGTYRGTTFSVHPVKSHSEPVEKYGDRLYSPMGLVYANVRIEASENSMFLPHTYKVSVTGMRNSSQRSDIRELVSYDGFYYGILDEDDRAKVRGKLEKVYHRKSGEKYHRILVGSPEAKGMDYIKPSWLR